jgi:predicted unusual protein kinase regulating ubiquinone biosynthesis (AarF/ABC1/UbiB family)
MFPNSNNLSNKLTVFVMGRAGNSGAMTLEDYYLTYSQANTANIQRRVEYLISEMALRGVSHGDLHPGNIIVTVGPSGRILGMWVIDFGRSRVINKRTTERRTHNKLAKNYRFPVQSLFGTSTKNVLVRNGSRANVHMMNASYNKRLSPSWERKISTMRKQIGKEMKQYKSPNQTTSPRKTKSLSLAKRRVGPSPARPQSAPARIAGLKATLKRKRSVA